MKARSVWLATVMILAACSRSGTVYGDIFIQAQSGGEGLRAARIYVLAVPSTEGFEREWASAVAAFQAEVEPARRAQKAAADSAADAKLAWDKSLTARRSGPLGTQRRIRRSWMSVQDRQLWNQMLAADDRLFKAKSRAWEIARKHDARAMSVLDRHMAQRVLTDENGHYVLAGVPAGKGYVYARFTVGDRALVWFRPVEVRSRPQQVDLTVANSGGWPFVP